MAQKPATTRIPRQLRESDVHGKGAAEIGWGTPGDFDRCRAFMRRHNVPGHEIDGACANLHRIATGEWPGPNAHKGHLASAAVISLTAAAGPADADMVRWHGPLALVGEATGDRRRFPHDTLKYQTFPQPFRFQRQGLPGHQGAVTVGVIEHAQEQQYPPDGPQKELRGKRVVYGHGYFLDSEVIPEVKEAIHLAENGVTGPSVDLDSYTAVLKKNTLSGETTADMVRGRQRAATLVSVPAFADLRITVVRPKALTASLDTSDVPDAANVASDATFAVNATGWRNAPIAPREALFDADEAAKRIEAWANGDPNKMASMFLWVNDTDGPLLGRQGYRLPWGDIVDNKPYLIYHAVYAAAALLQGGHGGLPNIPEEEKGKLRTIISSIYENLAQEFNDPSIQAPWDRVEQQQASGEPEVAQWQVDEEDGEYASYASSYTDALEEFVRTNWKHRYDERKHPRDPRHDKHAGEWVDTPHGPHGQIKVGGKWVYPPKRGEKGYKNPERSAREIARRGGGKSGGTRVAKKATAQPKRHPAPAASKPRRAGLGDHVDALKQMDRQDQKAYLRNLDDSEINGLVTHLGGQRLEGDTRDDLETEIIRRVNKPEGRDTAEKEREADRQRAQRLRELDHGEGRKTVVGKKETPKKEAKVTVGRKRTGEVKEHKLTGPQQSALERLRDDENAKVHPATRKVLEREGYLDSEGKLTQKSRDHLGVKEAPKKETPVKEVAKKTTKTIVAKKTSAGHKVTPAQQRTLESLKGGTGQYNQNNPSIKVLEREGYVERVGENRGDGTVGHYRLTQKGRDHLGVKEAPKRETAPKVETPKLTAKERNEIKRKENIDFLSSERNEEKVVARLMEMKRSELIAVYTDPGLNPLGGGHDPKWSDNELREQILQQWRARQRNISMREEARRAKEAAVARKQRFEFYQQEVRRADEEHRNAVLQARTKNPLAVSGTSYGGTDWTRQIKEDTGPLGIPVKNLRIDASGDSGGYLIKSGRVVRRNGVAYLIEDDSDVMADEMADFLEATHKDLPGADQVVKGYAWLKGESPNDAYWQKRFNDPSHQAAASSGDGVMRFWGPGNREGLEAQRSRAKHEYGHNVDALVASKERLGSNSARWHDAAEVDSSVSYPRGWLWDRKRNEPSKIRGGADREAPLGVSDYGKSSWMEDYAESLDMYLRGEIGTAFVDGKRVPVYFRDLFPRRARILDELFPDIGDEQTRVVRERGRLTYD